MKSMLITIIFMMMITDINAQNQSSKQTLKSFEKEINITVGFQYLIYLPIDYDKADKKFPLVLFLHGAGERGTDIEAVKRHGPPRLVETGKDFPFILVSPQCPESNRWNNQTIALSALLDEIESKYNVDERKIYVTGLSMGGQGTWSLALAQPHRFAAIAPICGWTDTFEACKIKHLPAWVFHGAKDSVVPLRESEEIVGVLKKCGAEEIKFTIFPEAGHDSWTETYNNDELYEWLLSHSLKNIEE